MESGALRLGDADCWCCEGWSGAWGSRARNGIGRWVSAHAEGLPHRAPLTHLGRGCPQLPLSTGPQGAPSGRDPQAQSCWGERPGPATSHSPETRGHCSSCPARPREGPTYLPTRGSWPGAHLGLRQESGSGHLGVDGSLRIQKLWRGRMGLGVPRFPPHDSPQW